MEGVYHGQSTHSNVSKVHRAQELLLIHQPAIATTEPVAVPDSPSGKTDLSFPGSCYYHKSWNQHQAEVTKNKITAGTFFHHPGRKLGHLAVEGSRGIPRPDQQTGS